MKKTQIVESFITTGQILEAKGTNDAILCRARYQICSIGEKNRNNRMYEKSVWEKVLADKDIQEKLTNKSLFFHAEHPTTTQSNTEKVAGVVTDLELNEAEKKVYAIMEVLDTPYGHIVDTLLRAGCGIGVSTRADGELEEAVDESGSKYSRVVPESYRFVTVDFTADPSSYGSELPLTVERDVVSIIKTGLDDSKIDREYASVLLNEIKIPEAVSLLESMKEIKEEKKELIPSTLRNKLSIEKELDNAKASGDSKKVTKLENELAIKKNESAESTKKEKVVEEKVVKEEKVVEEKDKVVEERGEGLGVGGPAQGDGGADVCVCPECGEEMPHSKGLPCTRMECCKCGASMTGKDIEEKEEEVDEKLTSSSDISGQPANAKSAKQIVNKSAKHGKKQDKTKNVKLKNVIAIEKVVKFLEHNWGKFVDAKDAVHNVVKVFGIEESNAKEYVEKIASSKGSGSAVSVMSNEEKLSPGTSTEVKEVSKRLTNLTAERNQLVESYGKDAISSTVKIKQLHEEIELYKKQGEELTHDLSEKTTEKDALSTEITGLTEQIKELNEVHIKDITELKESHKETLVTIQAEKTKELAGLKEVHTKDLIKFYVDAKVKSMGLNISESTLTLLESSKTVEEVDNTIRKVQNVLRENLVQSAGGISEVILESQSDPNPVLSDIRKKVGIALTHFGV